MSVADYIDFDYDQDDDEPQRSECRHCGKGNLTWENDNGSWRQLEANGRIHRCDPKRTHADAMRDFDEV